MTNNQILLAKATAAINAFFSDTSVPQTKTFEGLEEIADDVQGKIDAISTDIESDTIRDRR